MLRIHFTAGDLARTRIAEGPDPLWETVLSVHQLREKSRDPLLDGWRRRRCARGARALRFLSPLMPPRGYFPDFLTPGEGSGGLECGIDAVLATPRRRLTTELGLLSARTPLPPWARPLAAGKAAALRQLGLALREYHASVLEPGWRGIASRIDHDRRARAEIQCRLGTEEMLRTFAPALRWQSPVLLCGYPVDRDVHLQGRGLLLVPSYFCRHTPVALLDEELWPVLVYPARPVRPEAPTAPSPRLAPLLGHTRAAVLQALQMPCTTSELAHCTGISVSSASEHATVLRRAGLVASTRQRHHMRHTLTQLGSQLLAGGRLP